MTDFRMHEEIRNQDKKKTQFSILQKPSIWNSIEKQSREVTTIVSEFYEN